jgi:WD40 repeat protein
MLTAACRTAPQGDPRIVPQLNPVEPRRAYFSPTDDNRLLVMEANGRVGIWDLEQPARLFASLRARAIDASFSPDGRFVATVGLDGRVRWWTTDGKLQWVSETGHEGPARAVAVSSDLIVSGGEDGTLRLWKLDGSPLGPALQAHDNPVVSVDVSSVGDLVSLGGDEAVLLWKKNRSGDSSGPPTFEKTVLYQPETRRFGSDFRALLASVTWGWDHSVAFSPKGDLIAAALFDRSLRLWNVDGTSQAVVHKAHNDLPVRSLSFSAQGDLIASVGFDGALRSWNLDGSPSVIQYAAHTGAVFSVSFSRRGDRLVTTGLDNKTHVWQRNGELAFNLPEGRPPGISTVALATKEPVLAVATKKGNARTWSFDGKLQATLQGTNNLPIKGLTFSPSDDAIAGGANGELGGIFWIWQRNGKLRGGPFRVPISVDTLAFDPSGETLAIGTRPFQLWKGNEQLWEQPIRIADSVISIAFPPAGDFIVTGSVLGHLHVWNLDGTIRAYRPKQGIEVAGTVVVTPQGDSFIATLGATQTVVQEFDLNLSPRGAPFEGHLGKVSGLVLSPDGRLVSGGEDGTIRLWTLPERELQTIFVGLPIDQLGFWRDLVWVRADGEWLFFYQTNGTLVASVLLGADAEGPIVFTPDGWYSAPTPGSRKLHLYDDSGDLIAPSTAAWRRSPELVVGAIERAGTKRQSP